MNTTQNFPLLCVTDRHECLNLFHLESANKGKTIRSRPQQNKACDFATVLYLEKIISSEKTHMKKLITSFLFVVATLFAFVAQAQSTFTTPRFSFLSNTNTEQQVTPEPDLNTKKKKSLFKNKSISFFPVPVVETRPDEGQTYGVMPVLLFSEEDSKAISIILSAIGQWNNIVKWSGAGVAFWYPNPTDNPDEVLELYFELAQRYFRETTVRYFNPKFLDHFFLQTRFVWLKTPFRRFYGYGERSIKADESNYTSRNFDFETTFGYYLTDDLRLNLTEHFTSTDLLTRAFTNTSDTLTRYGGLPGVNDATTLLHKISLTYDTRPNGLNSKRGVFIEGTYFFSIDGFLSDQTINGVSTEAIALIPFFDDRTITVLRFFAQDMYGSNIPFYLQSQYGGAFDGRAFIPNRFTDTGKVVLTWEQRIRVLALDVFDIPVEFYADPFFEVGRVFNHVNNLGPNHWQPIAGLGLRAVVPPNVVGRLDIAVSTEGYSVYTMLGYPF